MQSPDTTIALLDAAAAQAVAQPQGIETVMLAGDKIPVVLAVVLVVWAGILLLLVRTERRLARVERALDEAEAPRTAAVRSVSGASGNRDR